ncbi:MAG: hypothetical protein K1V92_10425, partial [Bacteroides acidifaciens]|uniref:hypothetical protein n=1 Tax=Bacteroides acidifaciens TaxID=85831 RepID=UPI00242E130D
GLTPAIGASPNFVLPQKVLSDSNNFYYQSFNSGKLFIASSFNLYTARVYQVLQSSTGHFLSYHLSYHHLRK